MGFLAVRPIIKGPTTTAFVVGLLFPGLNERKLLVKKFTGGLSCQKHYIVLCVCLFTHTAMGVKELLCKSFSVWWSVFKMPTDIDALMCRAGVQKAAVFNSYSTQM